MGPGLIAVWIAVAVIGTLFGRFTASYDRPMPVATLLPVALAGAVVGGSIGLAVEDTFAAGAVGAGIGTALAIAARIIVQLKASPRSGA
jgi:hypothetical protein